eukprot:gene18569-24293_t
MIQSVRGGSVVALVTPMTSNNDIDYSSLQQLLKWHVKEGSDGAVVLGTTGESSTISNAERVNIIQASIEAVNGAFPIIIGTGTIETDKVIELTLQAKELGADAALIITPYYVKPPQRSLITHYLTIANAVDFPIILYNCPGRTGVDLKPETIGELSKHPNIIGVKDATGDLARVESLRKLCRKDFLLFSGEDDSGSDFVRIGGDGVISVTANVAPAAMHKLLSDSKNGRLDEANKINEQLMPLHKRLFLESNPIPVKKVLNLMGKIGNGIRPPLAELDPVHIPKIHEAMAIGRVL